MSVVDYVSENLGSCLALPAGSQTRYASFHVFFVVLGVSLFGSVCVRTDVFIQIRAYKQAMILMGFQAGRSFVFALI